MHHLRTSQKWKDTLTSEVGWKLIHFEEQRKAILTLIKFRFQKRKIYHHTHFLLFIIVSTQGNKLRIDHEESFVQ